eukprot:g6509.t1
MLPVSKLLGLLAVVSRSSVSGLDIDIFTCTDVQNVTAALVKDHVTARFADLWCEEWQTVVAHEMDEERELRIESLPDDEGQQQELTLKGVRFDIGRGVAVTFASDVHISRSSYHPQDTDGGALNVHDSSSVLFLGDLVLEHIEVEGSGGGMYIANDATVEVHGRATFHELGSKQNGGAVCTMGRGTFVAYGGLAATNNHAHNGGAIYNMGQIRTETEESEFKGNSAPLGAAIYNGWGADGVMFFASAKFENNRAFTAAEPPTINGEHIYSKNYVFFEGDATFVEGQTAIYVDGGLVEFEGAATFSGFTAGAIYTTYEPIYDNLKFAQPPYLENNYRGVGRCAAIAREKPDGSLQCVGRNAFKQTVH